ncbi:MAG: hypothetical protein HY885_04040 [Deltaproteobacteria bacterium]|nr:hypothetical protein [Deltaproteobacteria bacterium]
MSAAVAVLLVALSSCALTGDFPFHLGGSWQEEIQLDDGRKIVVKRSQTRGGRHEIGQDTPVAEHVISFTHPTTKQKITWESTYGITMDDASLLPLGLYLKGDAVYLATTTAGCIAYNKWGRPNPPYVFFQYDGADWRRIPQEEFPDEFKEANVVISGLVRKFEHRLREYPGPVPAEEIKKINAEAKHPDVQHLRVFVREPFDPKKTQPNVNCEELVYYKGAWISPGDSIGRRMMDHTSK